MNRLRAAPLQLACGTVFVIDETAMDAGEVTATGQRNLAALARVCREQKVAYDFQYHQIDFPTDVSVAFVSQGRSLLRQGVQCPLRPGTACRPASAQSPVSQRAGSAEGLFPRGALFAEPLTRTPPSGAGVAARGAGVPASLSRGALRDRRGHERGSPRGVRDRAASG